MQAPSVRKGPAPSGQLSSLPLDVLQKVASLMPLKDWAKASGACRLMHTLQLDVLVVADPSVARNGHAPEHERSAGVQWASRRWHCARSMRLEMMERSLRELADVLYCQPPDERPSSLKELLSFICHPSAAGYALLPWLASFTPQLSVLLHQANSLLMLPPLAHLKHLVLAQHGTGFSHAGDGLTRLQGLQTLSLECSNMSASTLPVLDLQRMGHLRRLNLHNVAPKRLVLPEGCRMSVRAHKEAVALMHDLDWVAALPVLQSLHLPGCVYPSRPSLAELEAHNCLRVLYLNTFSDLGTKGAPWRLGGVLARLESLELHATELVVVVPGDACWRVVNLYGSRKLSVSFEDARAFAAAADAFSFASSVEDHEATGGSQLAVLGVALTAIGKGWAWSAVAVNCTLAMHSVKAWCAQMVTRPGQLGCICGACMPCLQRAGLISAMPALQQPAGG